MTDRYSVPLWVNSLVESLVDMMVQSLAELKVRMKAGVLAAMTVAMKVLSTAEEKVLALVMWTVPLWATEMVVE